MKNLTIEQINDIPRLKAEGYTTKGIAQLYSCHQTALNYWIRRLKAEGHMIPMDKIGRPPLNLNTTNEKAK